MTCVELVERLPTENFASREATGFDQRLIDRMDATRSVIQLFERTHSGAGLVVWSCLCRPGKESPAGAIRRLTQASRSKVTRRFTAPGNDVTLCLTGSLYTQQEWNEVTESTIGH